MTAADMRAANDAQVVKLAVLAVGGQGGGVLANWIIDLVESQGWAAQLTSVPPGVSTAQLSTKHDAGRAKGALRIGCVSSIAMSASRSIDTASRVVDSDRERSSRCPSHEASHSSRARSPATAAPRSHTMW